MFSFASLYNAAFGVAKYYKKIKCPLIGNCLNVNSGTSRQCIKMFIKKIINPYVKDTQDKWVCEKYKLLNTLLEKAMATHSSTLAWKIPWTEEPGGLQSMGSLRVGHDWASSLSLFTFMHWRRQWQPSPVFLPGESQGRGSLVGCRLWSHRVGHDWSDLAGAAASECSLQCYSREYQLMLYKRMPDTTLSSSDTLLSWKPESWKRNGPFLTFQFILLASLNFSIINIFSLIKKKQ